MTFLNQTTKHIIQYLDDGNYHDGTSLGAEFNISRTAIWKNIKILQNLGIEIESIKGKGYRLIRPVELLDNETISNQINKYFRDNKLDLLETIDSTNTFLKQNLNIHNFHFCLSEQQTHGRGRFEREWYSPFAKNIYLSLKYTLNKDVSEASGLSLAIGVALLRALKNFSFTSGIKIKWPNDILFKGKKLAGILVEISAEPHASTKIIIGIGINVNMLLAQKEINRAWTSLALIKGENINRNEVIKVLIKELSQALNTFKREGLPAFINEYQSNSYLNGTDITLTAGKFIYKGNAKGINQEGHLKIELEDGSTKYFSSGEVTVTY